MECVNEALSAKTADNKGTCGILIDQPTAENPIYTRISDNLDHVKNMLEGEKAEEYGNPRIMFQNISKRWFGRDDAEVDVAIMMAELKIERIKYDIIKYDHSKEDSYMDAIAYLTMAMAFMQEGKKC